MHTEQATSRVLHVRSAATLTSASTRTVKAPGEVKLEAKSERRHRLTNSLPPPKNYLALPQQMTRFPQICERSLRWRITVNGGMGIKQSASLQALIR